MFQTFVGTVWPGRVFDVEGCMYTRPDERLGARSLIGTS